MKAARPRYLAHSRTSKLYIGSYTCPSTQMLKAKRPIRTYKSTAGPKKAFAIKKGREVTVKKISICNKDPRAGEGR